MGPSCTAFLQFPCASNYFKIKSLENSTYPGGIHALSPMGNDLASFNPTWVWGKYITETYKQIYI